MTGSPVILCSPCLSGHLVLQGESCKGPTPPRKAGTQQNKEQLSYKQPKRQSTSTTHRPSPGNHRKSNPRGKSQITNHDSNPARTSNAPGRHHRDLAGSSSDPCSQHDPVCVASGPGRTTTQTPPHQPAHAAPPSSGARHHEELLVSLGQMASRLVCCYAEQECCDTSRCTAS